MSPVFSTGTGGWVASGGAGLNAVTLLTSVHLIDIYHVIEAVRDAGLNAVELHAGISVVRLENLVSSLFNQLSKRLPTTHTIDPRESTVLLVELILAAVDGY